MDAKLKEKWVKALRSGRYRQARKRLRKDGAYCCLGVLCRVAKIKISRDGSRVDNEGTYSGYDPIWNLVGDEGLAKTLAMANDTGASFSKIARMIEASC